MKTKWIVARLSSMEFGAWIIIKTCPTKKRAESYRNAYQHLHERDVAITCSLKSFKELGFRFKFPGEWFKIVLGLVFPSYYYVDKCLVDVRHFFGVPYIMERREDFL